MSKLPWTKWVFDHWERDMAPHPPDMVGWWSLVLGPLHRSETTGKLTLPLDGWARIIRADVETTRRFIAYLRDHKIADIEVVTLRNGNVPEFNSDYEGEVTVINRRMYREYKAREATRLRVQRHRQKKQCNGSGNGDGNARLTGENKEDRRKKKEYKNPPNPPKQTSGSKSLCERGPSGASVEDEFEKLKSRYTDQLTLDRTFQAIASTRKGGKVAISVLAGFLRWAEAHSPDAVIGGCKTFLDGGYADEGKNEAYLKGIIRNWMPGRPGRTSEKENPYAGIGRKTA